MSRIVISYRRADNEAIVGRIRDKLASHYGESAVFMDVDSIPFGVDFRKHIETVLHQGEVVLAVMGPNWIGPVDGGRPRIFEETDPVRIEVETALQRGIPVVPVLVNGAAMPKPADLPDAIRNLSFRNAAEVELGRDFHQHMDRLIQSLDRGLGRVGPDKRRGRRRWVAALAAVLILAAGAAWFLLPQLQVANESASPPAGGSAGGGAVSPTEF